MKISRINLGLSVAVLSVSGLALYILAPTGDEGLPHPLNGLLREIHGLGAAAGLLMFGYFFADHVKKKLIKYRKVKTGRPWDGYVHLWLWIGLMISGLLLYYPQEVWSQSPFSVAQVHWCIGVVLTMLFPLHVGRQYLFNRGGR